MSLMNKLTRLAKSEKGKELIDKAQAMANDPKNREKIEAARGKVEQGIDAAKHKIAEKRGDKPDTPDTPAPVSGDATPDPASEAAVDAAADTTTPPPPPAYGGDDGPKAA